MKRIIILGATSLIAVHVARIYAARGAELVLVARDADRAGAIARDLLAVGAAAVTVRQHPLVLRSGAGLPVPAATPGEAVESGEAATSGEAVGSGDEAEAGQSMEPGAFLAACSIWPGGVDLVLLAFGVLTPQRVAETDLSRAGEDLWVNFGSAALWALAAASLLERQGHGTLAVIGSVAGDRGRASNYIYGAAKAGLGVLTEGIAHRLSGTGASALLVKPGLVMTPMTAHMARGGPLWARPGRVAAAIAGAIEKRRSVLYVPGFWWPVMVFIRMLPSWLMFRTRL